jgi:hypothetical protein
MIQNPIDYFCISKLKFNFGSAYRESEQNFEHAWLK